MSSSTAVRTVRKIHSLADNKTIKVPSKFDKPWFVEQAKALRSLVAKDVYLLSLHDDGVVWGKFNDKDELKTSDGIANSPSPEFRLATLQECRLFSARGELLIWRASETECKARQILDEAECDDDDIDHDGKTRYFDEPQVLWGVYRDEKLSKGDFTIVFEGQGLRHAIPLKTTEANFSAAQDENERLRPLRLTVRHYLDYDADGCAYVSLSRLIQFSVEGV